MSREGQIETMKAQIIVHQCYVTYFDARIRTGVYKSRQVQHGIGGPYFTEEELLADELATMLRHIRLMNEIIDNLNVI